MLLLKKAFNEEPKSCTNCSYFRLQLRLDYLFFATGADMEVCSVCWHVWLNILEVVGGRGGVGGRTCFMRVIDALLQEKRAKQA